MTARWSRLTTRTVTAVMIAVALIVVLAVAACGSERSGGNGIDATISRAEGYAVTNCHELSSFEVIARDVGDYGAKAYGCDGGLGVVVEPNGQIADFDAPDQPGVPNALTAAFIDARIIAQAKSEFGVAPKRVDCGSSADVRSGAHLRCTITLATGRAGTFTAVVHGRANDFTVVLG